MRGGGVGAPELGRLRGSACAGDSAGEPGRGLRGDAARGVHYGVPSPGDPLEHVGEQLALLDGVVKCIVGVRRHRQQRCRHRALRGLGVHRAGRCLVERADVEAGREAERRSAGGEALEVPVQERPVEGDGVGHEHGLVVTCLLANPSGRLLHRLLWSHAVLEELVAVEGVDGKRLVLESLGDRTQLAIERLVAGLASLEVVAVVGADHRQTEREHRVRPWNGAIGLDVGGDVEVRLRGAHRCHVLLHVGRRRGRSTSESDRMLVASWRPDESTRLTVSPRSASVLGRYVRCLPASRSASTRPARTVGLKGGADPTSISSSCTTATMTPTASRGSRSRASRHASSTRPRRWGSRRSPVTAATWRCCTSARWSGCSAARTTTPRTRSLRGCCCSSRASPCTTPSSTPHFLNASSASTTATSPTTLKTSSPAFWSTTSCGSGAP